MFVWFANNMKFEIPQIHQFGDGVCPHNVDISWKYTWKQLTIVIECWNLNKMHKLQRICAATQRPVSGGQPRVDRGGGQIPLFSMGPPLSLRLNKNSPTHYL